MKSLNRHPSRRAASAHRRVGLFPSPPRFVGKGVTRRWGPDRRRPARDVESFPALDRRFQSDASLWREMASEVPVPRHEHRNVAVLFNFRKNPAII